jgi:hypothetical protein
MDKQLLKIINNKAELLNIEVLSDFGSSLDNYLMKIDELNLGNAERKIVATYLSVKALNIAKVEKKAILDASDLKAALWHFHEPKDLNDTECKKAATFILNEHVRGLMPNSLPAEFSAYLNIQQEGASLG